MKKDSLNLRNPRPPKEQTHVEFFAPEYEYHPKGLLWFVAAGTVTLLLVVWSMMMADWIFALAILACSATYYALHREPPKTVKIRVTNRGIHVGKRFLDFEKLKQFWIVYDPPHVSKLYLRFRSRLQPDFVIVLVDQDPREIRSILQTHLSEWSDGDEPLLDTFARALRL